MADRASREDAAKERISCDPNVPILVTTYEPPNSLFQKFIFAWSTFTYIVILTQKRIVPGTFFYDRVLSFLPGGPHSFLWLVRKMSLVIPGIHLAEMWWLDRTRLARYGVGRGSGVWWLWISSCFLEGFPSFLRIDEMVERKRREVDNAVC